MHSAPSVSFPVGRSRMAHRLVWSVWLLAALMLAAWWAQFEGDGWRSMLLLAALLVAGIAARAATRLGESVQLTWNGPHWSCDGPSSLAAAVATVHLDFQSLMLIRLHEAGRRSLWIWLERASFPSRWLDVRRALHASAPARRISVEAPSQP